MTTGEAMAVLASMRDERLSYQVISDLITKASEAQEELKAYKKTKADLEDAIKTFEKLKADRVAEYEALKVDLAKNTDAVAEAKGKLKAEYDAAVEKTRLAKEAQQQAETNMAARMAKLDADIKAKEKQLDDLQNAFKKLADKADSLAA